MSDLLGLDPQFLESLVDSPWMIVLNLVDILLVTWLIYRFIKSLAGTRIMSLVQGMVLFVVLKFVADWLGLTTITYLMNQVITYGVIAAVVIFAPEIRSFLEKIGRSPQQLMVGQVANQEEDMILALVKSVKYLAPRKIGALVAIETTQTLREYMATGIVLDAAVSSQLLINIFIPNTPLHDGAVIISQNKVGTASSYLPLSESSHIAKEFGTRHRAAIGLSEASDALVVVVSEETGAISLAYKSAFHHDLSPEDLEKFLHQHLLTTTEKQNFWQRFWQKGQVSK